MLSPASSRVATKERPESSVLVALRALEREVAARRREGRLPTIALVAGTAALLLAIAAVMVGISSQHQDTLQALQREIDWQRDVEQARQQHADQIREMQRELDRRLRGAKSASQASGSAVAAAPASAPVPASAEIPRPARNARPARDARPQRPPAAVPVAETAKPAPPRRPRTAKPEISDDPLGGLEDEQPGSR
jgi:TolA-binding protein